MKNNPDKKPNKNKYKVLNNSNYNESLKKRGKINLHLPAGDLKEIFINENSCKYGVSGRSKYYDGECIIFICTIYRLFGCEVDNGISRTKSKRGM
ncbi:MAG: transposase [Rickettsiales bacterium]|nr:transposase [Rickettsiales bacterium]